MSLIVLLLDRKVCCWAFSYPCLSSMLSRSTAFDWLYFLLAWWEFANIFFFDNVPVMERILPFWPWIWFLSNFSTCPVDIRGVIVIGGCAKCGFVDGILIFLTDSRIICLIVFRNAFLNSVVLYNKQKYFFVTKKDLEFFFLFLLFLS